MILPFEVVVINARHNMRIAFVGKGGSGKSTLSASFATYIAKQTIQPVVVFDADLNIHTPELLGFETIPFNKHLSHPHVSNVIKKWLIGKNDIQNLGAFRKSTPPTRKSNILKIESIKETPLGSFGLHRENMSIFAVGTYQEENIGASCYHNNLATLESILNHTDDKNGYLFADMVAGVDSFAGTLHAQFDLTCLIVEPTMRSIEVYMKYINLATESGIAQSVRVIGNKIRDKKDRDFIQSHIPNNHIIGYFTDDEHIREIDQTNARLSVLELNQHNQELLKNVLTIVDSLPDSRNKRLNKIWELHKKYVAQPFVKERYGDLTGQIDIEFTFTYEI
jgi:CO dehydrogenase maturation factor